MGLGCSSDLSEPGSLEKKRSPIQPSGTGPVDVCWPTSSFSKVLVSAGDMETLLTVVLGAHPGPKPGRNWSLLLLDPQTRSSPLR